MSMETPALYPSRFDPAYLTHLENELDIEKLKNGALREAKDINGVTYDRCISIDFCGLAATTLFGTDLDREEITGEMYEARKRVAAAFEKIFERDALLKLNNNEGERFYLRVRFCFPYLYADYPVCLMKAELKEAWENMGDKPIDDYYVSRPLNPSQYFISKVRTAQRDSLSKIVNILKANDDLIILGGKEKKVNTIQVRFCTIPSPVCIMVINETAYCDSYFYAKSEPHKRLDLNYPILLLKKDDPGTGKGFANVRKHVDYLWRHDLTLFCRDATKFKPDNKEGLVELLKPEEIAGPDGTNWAHKERRIWEKKMEKDKDLKEKSPEELERISKWKANLNHKFNLCVRKISFDTGYPETDELTIIVGMRRRFYYFKIECRKEDMLIEFLAPTPNVLYCAIAHYMFAKLEGIEDTVMHKCCTYTNLQTALIKQLNTWDLNKREKGQHYFNLLFSTTDYRLKIPARQLIFDYDNREAIKEAKYPTRRSEIAKSCLDFEYP